MAVPAAAGGAPPPPYERYQGVDKQSAGYRLMASMGWQEGEGLGAQVRGLESAPACGCIHASNPAPKPRSTRANPACVLYNVCRSKASRATSG